MKRLLLIAAMIAAGLVGALTTPDAAEARPRAGYYGRYYAPPRAYRYYGPRYVAPRYYYAPRGYYYARPYNYGYYGPRYYYPGGGIYIGW
jgi:hypothetical protein